MCLMRLSNVNQFGGYTEHRIEEFWKFILTKYVS